MANAMAKSKKIFAYRRENGRVGVRNYVAILPVDDISNAACEAVANNIKGTIALPHAYGRLQFGEDLELHFRTMIGTGANPNVAACVVIGIEPGWTQRIVDGIAKTGKPVVGFSIERNGDIATIAAASLRVTDLNSISLNLLTMEVQNSSTGSVSNSTSTPLARNPSSCGLREAASKVSPVIV